MRKVISSLDELNKFAIEFAKTLKGGELIALKGDLGAGKTTFTKFLSKAIGVKEETISPTFNIARTYTSDFGPLYHIDAYRLEGLGYDPVLDDYLYDDKAIKIVEWYNVLDEDIFKDAIKIEFIILNKDEREIVIENV